VEGLIVYARRWVASKTPPDTGAPS
jgi:hypothetical protein